MPSVRRSRSRRPWEEMDHDHELLREETVLANRVEERGPIPEFLAKKRAEQAPSTARIYEDTFDKFLRFCATRQIQTVGQITEPVAHAFMAHERARGMAEGTVHDRVRRLKTWTRWMHKRGWTERDRWADVKAPHIDPTDFDLIEPEVRAALFAQYDPRTFLGARNQAILAMLSDCGVRREELCRVRDADVNLEDCQVRVYAPKTRRWRLIPFSDETAAIFARYRRVRDTFLARPARRRELPGDENHRVCTPRRLQTDCFLISQTGGPLAGDSVASILDRARTHLRAQGFADVRVHAHLFRHDYITRKALDGEHPSIVKRWVGHKTFAMTDRYFGIAESKLAGVRPKRSVLEGIVPLKRTRGRPARRDH